MREIVIPAGAANLSGVIHEPAKHLARKGTLIICHGFRGSKDGGGRAIELAERVAELGSCAVRFDFTPLSTLTRQIFELAAVVEYCRCFIGGSIYLLGRSMGGSAAIGFAGSDPNISGLCLWATPWNLSETFRLALGEHYAKLEKGQKITMEDEYGKVELGPEFIADFTRHDLLKSLKLIGNIPGLIIHGAQDKIVPLDQARDVYEYFPGRKKLVIIEDGDHQFTSRYQVASDTVIIWLRELLFATV